LAVASLGGVGLFCELNPILRLTSQVRGMAFTLSPQDRAIVCRGIRLFASEASQSGSSWTPATDLIESYRRCFGSSHYFSAESFDTVVRVRHGLDNLSVSSRAASPFIHLAALSSLVPSSLLIRRGDLRYRNPHELNREPVGFLDLLSIRLERMALDLESISPHSGRIELVAADAKEIPPAPSLSLDAVFTSPPYLNGTNYFRNTKLELWFGREIGSLADLTEFRRKAVTSGILDVHARAADETLPVSVRKSVSDVEEKAYDRRIPRMVEGYFSDISQAFRGVLKHLRPGAPVFIDIGDSVYNGVHVPTDRLLADCLEVLGLELEDRIVVRRRRSFDGSRLTQSLLRFRAARRHEPETPPRASQGLPQASWASFKKDFPHRLGAFRARNWGNPWHSLCSYQGKLKPSLAFHLVRAFAPPGSRVLDPFAGVGTIPFETAMVGSQAWAFEISPPAFYVSWAKLGCVEAIEARATIERLREYLSSQEVSQSEYDKADRIKFNGVVKNYFHPATFREILLARRYFWLHRPANPAQALVLASLLHILHGNRPYALSRRSHPLTPFAPTGPALQKSLISHLSTKVDRSLRVSKGSGFAPGRAVLQDATRPWPKEVTDLDCIITSPPFFASTRFFMGNWMRLWFTGWEEADFREKPGAFIDVRQLTSFRAYDSFFQLAHDRLVPGGRIVLHLGLSHKCDMARELSQVSARQFEVEDLAVESVVNQETHGETGKGTVTAHQYLVLKRKR
jgi:DNA modification methylase